MSLVGDQACDRTRFLHRQSVLTGGLVDPDNRTSTSISGTLVSCHKRSSALLDLPHWGSRIDLGITGRLTALAP